MTHLYKIIVPVSSFDRNLLPQPRISTEEFVAVIEQEAAPGQLDRAYTDGE